MILCQLESATPHLQSDDIRWQENFIHQCCVKNATPKEMNHINIDILLFEPVRVRKITIPEVTTATTADTFAWIRTGSPLNTATINQHHHNHHNYLPLKNASQGMTWEGCRDMDVHVVYDILNYSRMPWRMLLSWNELKSQQDMKITVLSREHTPSLQCEQVMQ